MSKNVFFFNVQYRASCFIEAYVRPGKYWLVCARLLANHLFNLNFIFLRDGLMAVEKWSAGFADVFRR
jgi:hypothetical protein